MRRQLSSLVSSIRSHFPSPPSESPGLDVVTPLLIGTATFVSPLVGFFIVCHQVSKNYIALKNSSSGKISYQEAHAIARQSGVNLVGFIPGLIAANTFSSHYPAIQEVLLSPRFQELLHGAYQNLAASPLFH